MEKQDYLVSNKNSLKEYRFGSSVVYPQTFSNGKYGQGQIFYRNFILELNDEDDLMYFKNALVFSDIYYNIKERPKNYLQRSVRLYSLGTQGSFYYGRLKNVSDRERKEIIKNNCKYNTIFTTFFIILLFVSVTYFNFSKNNGSKKYIFFPLVFMSIFSMALLLIGENQPRYMFMGWFLWPIIIAWFINDLLINRDNIQNIEIGNLVWNEKGVFGLLVFFATFYFTFKILFINSEYRFKDMSTWERVECNVSIDIESGHGSILPFKDSFEDKQYSTLKLKLPERPKQGDYVRISKEFDVEPNERYIFSTYVMLPSYCNDGRCVSPDVNIYINRGLEKKLNIADRDKYRYVKIEDIYSRKGKIRISFEMNYNIDCCVTSKQRESLVSFKFMSLRKSNN